MLPIAIATTVFIAIVVAVIVFWDIVVAFFNKVPNKIDTISGRMKIWGKKILFVPMIWAVLYGHFFGPKPLIKIPTPLAIPALLLMGVLVTLAGVLLELQIVNSWFLFFLILNLGAFLGANLWHQ